MSSIFKTVFVVWMTLTLGNMIANAASIPNRDTAVMYDDADLDEQTDLVGDDPGYKHGHWCIDVRVF